MKQDSGVGDVPVGWTTVGLTGDVGGATVGNEPVGVALVGSDGDVGAIQKGERQSALLTR